MQILSGIYKGQKLLNFPKNLGIRPTTQRVKKSIFDSLRPDFQSSKLRVLDLFSGTGQLSLEALSQGALECHAVEQNKKCCQLILKNAQKLKVKNLTLHSKDVFSFLKTYSGFFLDIIFIDPPFKNFYANSLVESLKSSAVCNSQSLVVFELSIQETLFQKDVQIQKEKTFGDKHVYFLNIRK